ncbi:MAG: Calcineurin-like phosphoesterase [Candidatus Bathyarchaeota archaeon BA1]|nr:MAG: Calcineurin-like phosphoesterase [Candidatus Bathyarchaeota archaeon BA1]
MVANTTFNVKETPNLINMVMKAGANEFLQLVEDAVQTLAGEGGRIGNLRINGRLVEVPPEGMAIVVGDIHGDLERLAYILKNSNFLERAGKSEDVFMVFLGDYGDRGIHSPEVYYVVLKLKEMFPENVVLMRGNHEGPEDILAYPHDLPIHLRRKFGEEGASIYAKLRELFNHLYNAVLIKERYVLLHGGAPSQASTMDDIAYAHMKHPRESHLEEILWSDPEEGITGTYPSPRGAGRIFGEDITNKLLRMLNVKALIRGHEPSMEGFKINHGGKVLTIFSRKGPPYYNEYGAYLKLSLSKMVENVEQIKQCTCIF